MRSLKSKLMLGIIAFVTTMLVMSLSIYAANEKLKIVKLNNPNEKSFIIYLDHTNNSTFINEKFQFAFTNEEPAVTNPSTLSYINSGKDTENDIYVAYVNEKLYNTYFSLPDVPAYMWIRVETSPGVYTYNEIAEIAFEGTNIHLGDVEIVNQSDLDILNTITNTIDTIVLAGEQNEYRDDNGVRQTKQSQKLLIQNTNNEKYYYQIIKKPIDSTHIHHNLIERAKIISNWNVYTKLYNMDELNEFANWYNISKNDLGPNPNAVGSRWIEAVNNEIPQPEDYTDNEEYLVWITNESGNVLDVEFMIAWRTIDEGYIRDVQLEETGDDNTLLIVFSLLVLGIIVVTILLIRKIYFNKSLNNKENDTE